MKPIEPGCLVMVIDADDSSLIGLTGKAIRVIDEAPFPGTYWEVYESPSFHNQKCLMRIDGGEDESVTEDRESEVSA